MGVSEIYVAITSILLILCVATFSINTVPLNCRHIRRELSSWLPMKTDVRVPRRPFHDKNMQICYNGRYGNRKSCCSNRMENKYLESGNKQIRKLISLRNFQKLLKSKRASFKKDQLHFYSGLVRYMMHFLVAKFRISNMSMRDRVTSFFSELLSNHTRPSESDIVAAFIVDVSPLLYFHSIKHGSDAVFDQRKRECLADAFKRRTSLVLAPKPDSPLITALKRSKRANQRLRASLRLLLTVLERLEALDYPDQCLRAMARNHLCPNCFGTANSSSVCLKTCQNVFHGCHIHWADLESTWNRFMDGLRLLTENMGKQWDLGKPMEELIELVVKRLHKDVMKELRRLDNQLISDCFVTDHKIEAVPQRATTTGPTPKFPAYMRGFRKSFNILMKSKINFFKKLVRKPCQKLPSTRCWNGTHLSVKGYSKDVPLFQLHYQKRNPEVNRQSEEQKKTVEVLKRDLETHRSKLIQDMSEQGKKVKRPPKKAPKRRRQGSRRRQRLLEEGSGDQRLPEGSGAEKHKPIDEEDEFGGSGSSGVGELSPVVRVRVPDISEKPRKRNYTGGYWRPQTTSTTSITYHHPSMNKPSGRRRVAKTDKVTARGRSSAFRPSFVSVWLLILLPRATVVSW